MDFILGMKPALNGPRKHGNLRATCIFGYSSYRSKEAPLIAEALRPTFMMSHKNV